MSNLAIDKPMSSLAIDKPIFESPYKPVLKLTHCASAVSVSTKVLY